METIKVTALPAFKDNYIWVLSRNNKAIVVDPGTSDIVTDWLSEQNQQLMAIFITHHHLDHTGGIVKLIKQHPNCLVYGKDPIKVPYITHLVDENSTVDVLNLSFKVIAIPGHTLDHVAYFANKMLFCGDTLFSGGCGRLFEGTAQQMYHSLQKIVNLPEETKVYCAHEYTQQNLLFAQALEPNNENIKAYLTKVRWLREKNMTTLPSTIALEKEINPFLRTTENELILNLQKQSKLNYNDPVGLFAALRTYKDKFIVPN